MPSRPLAAAVVNSANTPKQKADHWRKGADLQGRLLASTVLAGMALCSSHSLFAQTMFDGAAGQGHGDPGGTIQLTFEDEEFAGLFVKADGGRGKNGEGTDEDDGGNGGNGGNATVEFGGKSYTNQDLIIGVAVTARGGDGGTGSGDWTDDTDGGHAGYGGRTTLIINAGADIETYGFSAFGAYSGSVGGNGGNAGSFEFAGVGVGGDGGNGGGGNFAEAENNGTIRTHGEQAVGLYVQANGGSAGNGAAGYGILGFGGNGGEATPGGVATGHNDGIIVTKGDFATGLRVESIGGGGGSGGGAGGLIAVGGSSESGNFAGLVVGGSTGEIVTEGAYSRGVHMMSIGGGGGDASAVVGLVAIGGDGAGGGNGGAVNGSFGGYIQTGGRGAQGVLLQSIGGGGGAGGDAAGLTAIGGNGAGGGNGGAITVNQIYNPTNREFEIQTYGDLAAGFMAQSIGGGGGAGGFAITGGPISVGIGGDGNVGGNAGDVTFVTRDGRVTTHGGYSAGVVLQSIGGGGGDGGATYSAGDLVGVSIGGKGGSGGHAGKVFGENGLDITTFGEYSAGLRLQSIGGGGGSGGGSGGGGVGLVTVKIGGDSDAGGNAGAINFVNNGAIQTGGDGSHGISAQSIGGGGGDGGFSIAGQLGVAIAIGGDGGAGGNGDSVTLTTVGDIQTAGLRSHAVLAQSIGGGGGSGGSSYTGSLGLPALSIGGDGTAAGHGGVVTLNVTEGAMSTDGDFSVGILAQSIGGGGGEGGAAAATGAPLALSIGGDGAAAGDGDVVTVTSEASIITRGHYAHGIAAQSIGGGGGIGGSTNGNGFGGVSVTLGGDGASGGIGRRVEVTSTGGLIDTRGMLANAILAQSIGGGGGSGGVADAFSAGVTLGAAGDAHKGGNGAEVKVTNSSDLTARGVFSNGILAQSIGGGGGAGGGANADTATAIGGSISIGGTGGAGGNASRVDVIHSGAITVGGDFSRAIKAQSIGGGGGDGGYADGVALNAIAVLPYPSGTVTVAIGGDGGQGGDGDDVTVRADGDLLALGAFQSGGILAQSIGGGGGSGGANNAYSAGVNSNFNISLTLGGGGETAGKGGDVLVTTTVGSIKTWGNESEGILAQSIGGGGGKGGYATSSADTVPSINYPSGTMSIAVGGSGGEGNIGGRVTVANAMHITTRGDLSVGISAQSIGGGGGDGGISHADARQLTPSTSFGMTTSVTVGGSGGDGNIGGTVTVENDGNIVTEGAFSHGILGQSIGGGGGKGGDATSRADFLMASTSTTVGLAAGLGGMVGAGNHGGDLFINNRGQIITVGFGASGILAQSVGGSGGSGGSAQAKVDSSADVVAALAIGGFGGNGGHGGIVSVTNSSAITTLNDYAFGIFASSLGGGGGHGGTATSNAKGKYAIGATLGGFGAAGDYGGDVFFENLEGGTITTVGNNSIGVLVQSIGGSGGSGGAGNSSAEGEKLSVTLSVGGFAGDGSYGGRVDVDNAGSILTLGALSHGLLVQSVGGSGGHGGASAAENDADQAEIQVNVSMGGLGGTGGYGGTVIVDNQDTSSIETRGYGSYGVLAQSIGGGGGTGGSSGAASGAGDVGVALSVGGIGGAGNHGGLVVLTNAGQILTRHHQSHAVFAQSVGGGGGAGATSKASSKSEISIGGTVGGFAGAGGEGGEVRLVNSGRIASLGDDSFGVFAQSVGGGGGAGGGSTGTAGGTDVAVSLSVGGFGGFGGLGDKVSLTNSGIIETAGRQSHAVFAQSVGGGGGAGGMSSAGDVSNNVETEVTVSVGGFGGVGGLGGDVTIINTQTGRIATLGYHSIGVFAQSIGGGGGAGGVGKSATGSAETGVNMAMGGWGGIGNLGGAVSVTNEGLIETAGALSHGILAQSIGGGGGAAAGVEGQSKASTSIGGGYGGSGGAGAHGGTVTVDNKGVILTSGDGALGIFAQSVGGGGGYVGASTQNVTSDSGYAMQIGGMGGAGGNGGNVTVTISGLIHTLGVGAHGVVAQSIGGGGGYGGDVGGTGADGLSIGGFGGNGGNGGDVTVIRTGNIITEGRDSIAIIAQSVGGGGGIGGAGFGRFSSLGDGSTPDSIGFSSFAGDRGTGGIVSIVQNGAVETFGDRSHGVVAQAVGGGGGFGGSSSLALGQSAAGSQGGIGHAEAVGATVTEQVIVHGASAYGLFGQSATGQGKAKSVTLNAMGSVVARGMDSVAAYGESSGLEGRENITITLGGEFTVGGGGLGQAVMLVGGVANRVTNRSMIFALGEDQAIGSLGDMRDSFSNIAISGTYGDDSIDNLDGRIIGNFAMGAGQNRLLNRSASSVIGLQSIDLGQDGLFADDGLTSILGIGTIGTTALTGGYRQSSSGRFVVDIDPTAGQNDGMAGMTMLMAAPAPKPSDIMTISGSGDFTGVAELNFLNIDGAIEPVVVATAAGGMSAAGFTPTFRRPTYGISFLSRVDDGTDLVVYADKPAFAELADDAGLPQGPVRQFAGYLDQVEAIEGSNPMMRTINMLRFLPDAETFADSMIRLTPHYVGHSGEVVNRLTDSGLENSRICGTSARQDDMLANCIWAEYLPDGDIKTHGHGLSPSFRDDIKTYSFGGQVTLSGHVAAMASFSYSEVDSVVNGRDEWLSNQKGDNYAGYFGFKYAQNRFFADLLGHYSEAKFRGLRNTQLDPFTTILGESLEGEYFEEVALEGIGEQVTTKAKVQQFGLSGRLGYRFDSGAFYYEPSVQVDGRWTRIEAVEEGSAAAFRFAPHRHFTMAVSPTFEAGAKIALGSNAVLRPFVKGSATFTNARWEAVGGFAALEDMDGAPRYKNSLSAADPLVRASAGAALEIGGVEVSVRYTGAFSTHSKQNGVAARLGFRF